MKKNENDQLPVEAEKNNKIAAKISEIKKKAEEKRLSNDIVFSEPLSAPKTVDETAPLKKGGIDMWFLLWAMILMCFGAVMSYSASAVYAEQIEGQSAVYYLIRYIVFSLIACAITVPFVIYARPWFWRIFGAGAYVVAVIFLLLVLVLGVARSRSWCCRGRSAEMVVYRSYFDPALGDCKDRRGNDACVVYVEI